MWLVNRLVVLIFALLSIPALAASVNSGTTTIKEIYSYADVGASGDLVFTVNAESPIGASECIGFWLDSTAPGFNNNLSFLLSAYHAASPVLIYGKDDELFPKSSGKYCRMTIIRFRPKS
jgi:hypothetical protein